VSKTPKMSPAELPTLEGPWNRLPPPEYGFVIRTEMLRNVSMGQPEWQVEQQIWIDGQLLTIRDRVPDIAGYPILEMSLEKMKHGLLRVMHKKPRRPCATCGRSDDE